MEDTNLIHKALKFASKAHSDQVRKGTDIPYIAHPMEAALILSQAGASETLIAAALLHDTLEDTPTTEQDLEYVFGSSVTELVKGMTKDTNLDWQGNRQHSIDRLAVMSMDEMLLLLSDKLANLRSIAVDYAEIGDALWNRFNRGYADQKWYYSSLADGMSALGEAPAYLEYKRLVQQLFADN